MTTYLTANTSKQQAILAEKSLALLAPCGETNELDTKWIESSQCDQWYHTECLLIKTEALEALARPDTTYTCPQCLIQNILHATHPKIRLHSKALYQSRKIEPQYCGTFKT